MKINHNISAQLASVSLKKNESKLSTSLEKLSSGYKITKAADDSAGLAISNKMRTQIRALNQSSRNAEDGQSIIETADGSLAEIQSLLQRVRELSVQASNGTYTMDDRESAQDEIDQLLDEVDRISSTTEFNGKSLFDGSASRTMTSNVDGVKSLAVSMEVTSGEYNFTIDSLATCASASLDTAVLAGGTSTTITINAEVITIDEDDTQDDIESKIVDLCDKMNITYKNGSLYTNACGAKQTISIQYEGEEEATTYKGSDAEITITVAGAGVSGFSDTASYTSDGNNVTIIDNKGFEMQIELPNTSGMTDAQINTWLGNHGDSAVTGTENANSSVTLNVYNAGYMSIQIGANEHQTLDMDFPEVSCETLKLRDSDGVDLINVCTQNGATNAIDDLDSAIASISAARSQLGAYQNRLESTVASLDVTSENMTDAMSRIMDTDMASEMTQYTQYTVLQQASTSMLSQANNRPQEILSLIQGM